MRLKLTSPSDNGENQLHQISIPSRKNQTSVFTRIIDDQYIFFLPEICEFLLHVWTTPKKKNFQNSPICDAQKTKKSKLTQQVYNKSP